MVSLSVDTIILLKKFHGTFMIFSWCFCVILAIFCARFLKGTSFGKTRTFGKARWFQIHRALNGIAVVLTLCAFVFILVAKNGVLTFVIDGPVTAGTLHSIFGFMVVLLGTIQPINALLRPDPEHRLRPLFNWGHRMAGSLAWMFSALCLYQATAFPYLNKYSATSYLLWTVWLLTVVVFVFMEVFTYMTGRRAQYVSINAAENPSGADEKSERMTLGAGVLFGVTFLCLATALVVIVAMPEPKKPA